MSEQYNELTASYYRCRATDGFMDTFYELFLGKSPEIAAKFEHTDFKTQKLMLRQSLLEMLCFDRGMAGTHEEIARLGHSHKEMNIAPEMYAMWVEALCETIQRHDPEYTPELEQEWRGAVAKTVDRMLAAGTGNGDEAMASS